jgi:hypothetical protein
MAGVRLTQGQFVPVRGFRTGVPVGDAGGLGKSVLRRVTALGLGCPAMTRVISNDFRYAGMKKQLFVESTRH